LITNEVSKEIEKRKRDREGMGDGER